MLVTAEIDLVLSLVINVRELQWTINLAEKSILQSRKCG